MVKCQPFEIQILQDGTAAVEHLDPTATDDEATITRYVEIKEDQNFAIELKVHPEFELGEFDALCMEIYFDGRKVRGKTFSRKRFTAGTVFSTVTTESFFFGEATTRELKAGEDEEALREEYTSQGVLEIRMSRVSGYSCIQERPSHREDSHKIVPKTFVREKSSTSIASYIKPENEGPRSVFVTTDEEDEIATFILKYRTMEALKDHKIVPNPVILHPGETFTDDEFRAENERLRAENERLRTRIKQEDADEHRDMRHQKRKYLEMSDEAEIDLINERQARRRMPTATDVVIEIDG